MLLSAHLLLSLSVCVLVYQDGALIIKTLLFLFLLHPELLDPSLSTDSKSKKTKQCLSVLPLCYQHDSGDTSGPNLELPHT